jgi:hypothetical protein
LAGGNITVGQERRMYGHSVIEGAFHLSGRLPRS